MLNSFCKFVTRNKIKVNPQQPTQILYTMVYDYTIVIKILQILSADNRFFSSFMLLFPCVILQKYYPNLCLCKPVGRLSD